MRFDLKAPCKDCPFIKGGTMNQSLAPGRMESIVHEITKEDKTFTCHKTLDLPPLDQQHCGGALIFLEKNVKGGNPNQMMRIAERLGIYDPSKLKMDADIIDK